MTEQLWFDEEVDASLVRALARRGHDVVMRPTVGGVTRVLETDGDVLLALDDARQEGLTVAV